MEIDKWMLMFTQANIVLSDSSSSGGREGGWATLADSSSIQNSRCYCAPTAPTATPTFCPGKALCPFFVCYGEFLKTIINTGIYNDIHPYLSMTEIQ